MKKLAIFSFCLVLAGSLQSQNEFEEYDNGLIYDQTTMDHLNYIADSLGLQFKTCDETPSFESCPQAQGYFVRLDKEYTSAALKAVKKNCSIEEFKKQFPETEVHPKELAIQYNYLGYKDVPMVEYTFVPSFGNISHEAYNPPRIPTASTWIFDEDQEYSFSAFFLVSDFEKIKLPEIQNKQVQYAECLIVPEATVFIEERADQCDELSNSKPYVKLYDHLVKQTGAPAEPEDHREEYYNWRWSIFGQIDSLVQADQELVELIENAADYAINLNCGNELLETLISGCDMKEKTLELKRNRIVYGQCSMDNSPRFHAMQIAQLSAETHNWDVFIRSHLDIMNDNFSRLSDGSYAWERRETYIKELESLNINVIDLILGITLRIDDPTSNHYYGSVNRLGRAMAESQNKTEFENAMISAITNDELDIYNRFIIFYLFQHYNYNLEEVDRQKKNITRLQEAIKSIPKEYSENIDVKGFYD